MSVRGVDWLIVEVTLLVEIHWSVRFMIVSSVASAHYAGGREDRRLQGMKRECRVTVDRMIIWILGTLISSVRRSISVKIFDIEYFDIEC